MRMRTLVSGVNVPFIGVFIITWKILIDEIWEIIYNVKKGTNKFQGYSEDGEHESNKYIYIFKNTRGYGYWIWKYFVKKVKKVKGKTTRVWCDKKSC